MDNKIDFTLETNGCIKVYPELADIEITPNKETQVFKNNQEYGYDHVTVKPIPEDYINPSGYLTISENGVKNVREFNNVVVDVPKPLPKLQNKEVTPTKEVQNVNADSDYEGIGKVTINPIPDEYIIPNGTLDINANGETDVTMFRMARIGVHTPPTLQDKTITITENGSQTISADSGYDGLSNVNVNVEVSSGDDEFPSINLFTELSKEVRNMTENYMKRFVKHYTPLKNEGVTLYTPDSACMNYIIYKNSANGGSYDIVWTQDGIPAYSYEGHINVYYFTVINTVYGCTVKAGNTNNNYYYPVTYKSDNSYSSVEECINAMKDSSTTYSTFSNLGSISCYGIEATSLIYINSGIPQIMNRISNNETINVIG